MAALVKQHRENKKEREKRRRRRQGVQATLRLHNLPPLLH